MTISDTPDSTSPEVAPIRHSARVIAVLSAGNFAIGMGAFIVTGIMTPLANGLDMTKLESGLVLTVYALAYAIGSPLLVSLTGSRPRVFVLTAGMTIFLVGALVSAMASDSTILYVARVVAALGAGLFTPVTSVVAMAVVAPTNRGKALSQVFLGFTLAQVLGVPAGSYIGYTFGWQAAFLCVAALSAICLAGVLRYVPRALNVQSNSLETLWQVLTNLKLMSAIMFTASYIGCNYVVITLFAPLLESSMGYARDGVTSLLMLYGLGAVFGNLLGGVITDRLGPRVSLVITCLSQVLLLPVYSILPMPDAMLFAATLLWSTLGWAFMVPQQARLISAAPDSQSVVLALNAAAVYVGASFGSIVAGLAADTLGLQTLGLIGGLVALFAFLNLLFSERLLSSQSAT
ncbi:MAG: MFS transporter [Burkholderiaceae bacterium]